MKLSLVFFLALAIAAQAQSNFHAYPGTEHLIEGGQVEKLTVVSGSRQFNIRPPRNWYRQVDESNHKVIFTSPSGKSAVTVQFSDYFPGKLPDEAALRAKAQQEHPGAGFVQYAMCSTGEQPGAFVDLVRIPAPQVVQKIRHAFATQPGGTVEFILAASGDEFEKNSRILMGMLRAFRSEPLKSK